MLNQEFRPDRVALARKQKGMTQKTLAELVGISEAMIIGMEKGRKRPSMRTAEKLASALNCPINWLFGAEVTGSQSDSSVISIMSKLVIKLLHGVATAEDEARLGRIAALHVDDDQLNGSAISCYNSGPASISPLGDAPDVDVLALRAALGIALAS